jgi:hypothetical protein
MALDLDLPTFVRAMMEGADSVGETLAQIHPLGDAAESALNSLTSQIKTIVAENLNIVSMFALAGILCHVLTPLMRTMVPLRISFIFSDSFFIIYGTLSHSYITLVIYSLLLPINSLRLYQMLRLVRRARSSAQGDNSLHWLKPFTSQRKYRKGDVLFRKGDLANEMFFTVGGKFLVIDIDVELPAGHLVGEL